MAIVSLSPHKLACPLRCYLIVLEIEKYTVGLGSIAISSNQCLLKLVKRFRSVNTQRHARARYRYTQTA
jgi:hypothetical protein